MNLNVNFSGKPIKFDNFSTIIPVLNLKYKFKECCTKDEKKEAVIKSIGQAP
jgi:hypothetical protein